MPASTNIPKAAATPTAPAAMPATRPTATGGSADASDRGPGPSEAVFALTRPALRDLLAVGAELKASVCLYSGSSAVLRPNIGNLSEPASYRRFAEAVVELPRRCGASPTAIVHDLHPAYASTRLAKRVGLPLIGVQHHHAHTVTVMTERGIDGPVLALCCDGAGHGVDGATWGCELLECRADGFVRRGHHAYFVMPGGDAAAIETWRAALALLMAAFGQAWREHCIGEMLRVPPGDVERLARHCETAPVAMQTSSLGRIFDGVSGLLGLCARNDREAQAAVALEQAAQAGPGEPYPYETTTTAMGIQMSLSPAIRAIVAEAKGGQDAGAIAGRFHETVARMLASAATIASEQSGIESVVLAGGCFVNTLLRERVTARLEARGVRVVTPTRTGYGDGFIALGQAAIGAALVERVCGGDTKGGW